MYITDWTTILLDHILGKFGIDSGLRRRVNGLIYEISGEMKKLSWIYEIFMV